MLYYTILYYVMLYYIILYYIILYTYHLHIIYILFTYYIHIIYILYTYYILLYIHHCHDIRPVCGVAPVRTAAVLASAEWCHCHPVLAGWSSIIAWLKYWSYPLVICHGSHGPLIGDLPFKNGDFNNQRATIMMNGDNIGSNIDILYRDCTGIS